MKGKPLLPSLRTKKRYVAYEAISEKDVEMTKVYACIRHSFRECFGIFGLGKAGIMDTRAFNGKRGLLKINHKYTDHLRTAMSMITEIDGSKIIVNTVGVSGILKKAKARYLML